MKATVIATILAVIGAAVLAYSFSNVGCPFKSNQVATPMASAFNRWLSIQNKKYISPEEHNFRLSVFSKNFLKVQELNSLNTHHNSLNKFADLTEQEFVAKYTGLKVPNTMRTNVAHVKSDLKRPDSVDWRNSGAVNNVKDQGQCGSCWAFSATCAIEGAWKIANKGLLDLSEQQMVDCGGSTGNYGCNGGWMDWAFQYIINAGGQQLTETYPYTAKDGTCLTDATKAKAYVASFTDVPAGKCDLLLDAIAQQPVSVGIAANAIMFYDSGVFVSTTCGNNINHGVTAVGYGTDADSKTEKDFYLVRNSWGSGWGEKGYIRMSRTDQQPDGICAICTKASYPNVKA